MSTPAELLAQSLAKLRSATRFKSTSSGWRKDNPGEYAKVIAFLDGGARPTGVTSDMGLHALLEEDARRALGVAPPPPPPPLIFAKHASPSGSDSNPGTLASPYLTLSKLMQNLTAGQTGVLRGGDIGTTTTYTGWTQSGTATAPITIMSYPGETATILGFPEILGNYLTLKNVSINLGNAMVGASACNPVNSSGMGIYGSNFIIEHCDIFFSGGAPATSALYIGGGSNGIIRYCKIHDFGSCFHFDQGIYVGHHTNLEIHHNWIWGGNYGWGIQFYPAAVGCSAHHNVIDGCGSGFIYSDDNAGTCDDNQVYNNVVANSVQIYAPNGFQHPRAGLSGSGLTGTGNTFTDNDCWNNVNGVGSIANVTLSGNITTDPQFVNAAARDYSIKSGSPIASWNMWNGQ